MHCSGSWKHRLTQQVFSLEMRSSTVGCKRHGHVRENLTKGTLTTWLTLSSGSLGAFLPRLSVLRQVCLVSGPEHFRSLVFFISLLIHRMNTNQQIGEGHSLMWRAKRYIVHVFLCCSDNVFADWMYFCGFVIVQHNCHGCVVVWMYLFAVWTKLLIVCLLFGCSVR